MDHWGFTPSTLAPELRGHPGEGRGVSLDVDTRATPEQLWPLVTDIGLPSRFSEEAVGASWVSPDSTPALGHEFVGVNACTDAGHPAVNQLISERTTDNSWSSTCRVTSWEPNREFGYDVIDDDGNTATRWRFVLQPLVGGGTRVTHSMRLHSGQSGTSAVTMNPEADHEEILVGRFLKLRTDMTRTLHGLKATAERDI